MILPKTRGATEQELLQRIREGDSDALRIVFDRHAPALHRLATQLVGSSDDADDVVQDVFVGLPRALKRYTDQGTFAVWLRRVTTRAALMRARSERRRETTAQRADPPRTIEVLADSALSDALSCAVAELPASLRVVFVLRMIEEYSYDEIAGLIGTSASACKVRLHRALQRLRPQLEYLREDRPS